MQGAGCRMQDEALRADAGSATLRLAMKDKRCMMLD